MAARIQPSLRDLNGVLRRHPALETPGYYHEPLRGNASVQGEGFCGNKKGAEDIRAFLFLASTNTPYCTVTVGAGLRVWLLVSVTVTVIV